MVFPQTTFTVSVIPREAFSSPKVHLEGCKSVRWGGSSQPQEVQVFITVVVGNALFWFVADWKTGFLLVCWVAFLCLVSTGGARR